MMYFDPQMFQCNWRKTFTSTNKTHGRD